MGDSIKQVCVKEALINEGPLTSIYRANFSDNGKVSMVHVYVTKIPVSKEGAKTLKTYEGINSKRDVKKASENKMLYTINDIKISAKLSDYGCSNCWEYISSEQETTKNENAIYVVTRPYISLQSYLKKNHLSIKEIFSVLEIVKEAMQTMHEAGFAHGFISASSVLCDSQTRKFYLGKFYFANTNDGTPLPAPLLASDAASESVKKGRVPTFAEDYQMFILMAQDILGFVPGQLNAFIPNDVAAFLSYEVGSYVDKTTFNRMFSKAQKACSGEPVEPLLDTNYHNGEIPKDDAKTSLAASQGASDASSVIDDKDEGQEDFYFSFDELEEEEEDAAITVSGNESEPTDTNEDEAVFTDVNEFAISEDEPDAISESDQLKKEEGALPSDNEIEFIFDDIAFDYKDEHEESESDIKEGESQEIPEAEEKPQKNKPIFEKIKREPLYDPKEAVIEFADNYADIESDIQIEFDNKEPESDNESKSENPVFDLKEVQNHSEQSAEKAEPQKKPVFEKIKRESLYDPKAMEIEFADEHTDLEPEHLFDFDYEEPESGNAVQYEAAFSVSVKEGAEELTEDVATGFEDASAISIEEEQGRADAEKFEAQDDSIFYFDEQEDLKIPETSEDFPKLQDEMDIALAGILDHLREYSEEEKSDLISEDTSSPDDTSGAVDLEDIIQNPEEIFLTDNLNEIGEQEELAVLEVPEAVSNSTVIPLYSAETHKEPRLTKLSDKPSNEKKPEKEIESQKYNEPAEKEESIVVLSAKNEEETSNKIFFEADPSGKNTLLESFYYSDDLEYAIKKEAAKHPKKASKVSIFAIMLILIALIALGIFAFIYFGNLGISDISEIKNEIIRRFSIAFNKIYARFLVFFNRYNGTF